MRKLLALALMLLSVPAWATGGVPNHTPRAFFNGQGWLPDCRGYAPTTGLPTACPPGVRFRNHLDLAFIAPAAAGGSYNTVYAPGTQTYNNFGMDSTQFDRQNQVSGTWYTFPWSANNVTGHTCGDTTNIQILEYSGSTPFIQADLGPSVNPIIQCAGGTWKDHFVYWSTLVPGGANGHPYAIYYSGKDPSGNNGIGLTTADAIGGPWTDYGSNPILTGYYQPTVAVGPDGTRYLFTNDNGTSGKVYTIGANGITLTQVGITLTHPTVNDWDGATAGANEWFDEAAVRYNARHRMWEAWYMMYDGHVGGTYNQAIGYAVSPSPTGPWIRQPQGPTLWFNTRAYTSTLGGGTTAVAVGCPTVIEQAGIFMLEFCAGTAFPVAAGQNGWIDFMVDY